MTSICVGAFSGCTNLEKGNFPANLDYIGFSAFEDCTSLKGVNLLSDKVELQWSAFKNCTSLENVQLADGLTYIDNEVFCGCTNLMEINLPSSLIEIGGAAFEGCTSLQEIKLSNSLKIINGRAFAGCTGLKKISIPQNVKSIGENAFYGCSGLSDIVFEGDAPVVDRYYQEAGEVPFHGLTAIYYPASNPTWTEEARMELGKDLKWVSYGERDIPANVKVSANTYNSLKVTWNKAIGAQYYQVYRFDSQNGSYAHIGTYTGDTTSVINRALICGKTYYYKVRAYAVENGKAVYSGYSSVASGKTALSAPKEVKASANTYNTLKISWNKVDGANYYQVYRSSSPNGKYALLGTYDSNTASSISKGLGCGTTYYYKVRAYRWVNGQRVFSGYSSVASGKTVLPAPKTVKAERASSSTVKISWSPVSGGQYYQVYRATSRNGSYALLGTYDDKTRSSISRSLKKGTTYYYKVRTYRWVNGQRVFSSFSTVVSATP